MRTYLTAAQFAARLAAHRYNVTKPHASNVSLPTGYAYARWHAGFYDICSAHHPTHGDFYYLD